MGILVPILGIMAFGGIGLLLIQAGRKNLKDLNKRENYGIIESLRGLAAVLQIGLGGIAVLFAINQIVIFLFFNN